MSHQAPAAPSPSYVPGPAETGHQASRPEQRAELTVERILVWAERHHRRTGRWPNQHSGKVFRVPNETWARLDKALRHGRRGLPGRSSLARLLQEERGVRHKGRLPRLKLGLLLRWADAHHARTGQWPRVASGPIPESPGDSWSIVNKALTSGLRGLPGGSSLAFVLSEHRRARHRLHPPRLTEAQVLAWADEHYAQTGAWPNHLSGPVRRAPGETWKGLNHALSLGYRGFPGGSSLMLLLERARGVRNRKHLLDFTEEQILAWADAHHARTGRWPSENSGPIEGAPEETWLAVQMALMKGRRGLPAGSSLHRLLQRCRGVGKQAKGSGTL